MTARVNRSSKREVREYSILHSSFVIIVNLACLKVITRDEDEVEVDGEAGCFIPSASHSKRDR